MSSPIEIAFNSTVLPSGEQIVNISAVPQPIGMRKPCNIIAILDVSGSMGTAATVGDPSSSETHGFTRLDLVKHSMKSIIKVLQDIDHLALISFNEAARVVLPLTKMTESGQTKAMSDVSSLHAAGQTNIWGGLSAALEQLGKPECQTADANNVIVLLTDGEPNVNPPRGIVPTLKRAISDKPLRATIHTFGFGYSLDSELLSQISDVGSGCNSYIPDCSMVGTAFVNFISNALSAITPCSTITVVPRGGGEGRVLSWVGCQPAQPEGGRLALGSIQFGQTRDVVVRVTPGTALSATLTLSNGETVQKEYSSGESGSAGDAKQALLQYARLHLIDRVRAAFGERKKRSPLSTSIDILKSCVADLRSLPDGVAEDARVLAYVRDIESEQEAEGQVGKAFEREEWYDKWGKHYLPSLIRAHALQQCHNFKDPGVQNYGGRMFAELRDTADNIFIQLPPPVPSGSSPAVPAAPSPYGGGYSAAPVPVRSRSPPVDMSYYYNMSSGCFDGNAAVHLASGSIKRVRDLAKGDVLLHGDAKVVCVVETAGPVPVVDVAGLLITCWHPVRVGSGREWVFPADLAGEQKPQPLDRVFNLVLDSHHVANVGGVDVVTLGHGLTGPVVEHPYFGTDRVLEDLSKVDGWESGRIVFEKMQTERDPVTGLVTRMY